MRVLMFLFVSITLTATDHLYFIELPLDISDQGVDVIVRPKPLVSYDIIKDDRYNLERAMMELSLDAALRQTAFLFRTLERNRGTIMGKNASEPIEIMRYDFELGLRDLTGEPLQLKEYEVTMSLEPKINTGSIRCNGSRHEFAINTLTRIGNYRDFLRHLILPMDKASFSRPSQDEFLVDLYFKWPKVLVDNDQFSIFDLFPSAILWNKGPITRVEIHLGTTYAYRRDGVWEQSLSDHLDYFRQNIDAYTEILAMIENGDDEAAIPLLEDYLHRAPADKKALRTLMELYMAYEYKTQAYDLITRFQPFFATIKGGLDTQDFIAESAQRKRNHLLGKRSSFERNKDVQLEITSPVQNDLVTGTTNLEFTLAGTDSPILQIDCYLDEQRIAALSSPPFRVPFTVSGRQGRLNLRVAAYFEDETYQETQIRVRSLLVDQQEYVNLVGLRTVVTQGTNKLLTDLKREDFVVKENGVEREIQTFRKDQAPLRIAILVDTSISMFGKKLYNAQYAVRTFLSKLEPEDKASLYTFDHKVMRLTDFTNDFEQVGRQVFTLSPQLSTSLYDAILVANDDLEGQNGTKVIIIISDGSDSSSAVTDIHVASTIRNSHTMVYSIILPGNFLGMSNAQGNVFLREIARLSGSVSDRVSKVKNLDETFDKIYQELKSFYYIDFYASEPDPDKRDIDVKVKGLVARARFRTLN